MNAIVSSASTDHHPEPGLARRMLGWLRGDPRAALSLAVLVLILGTALLAPWVAPYDPAHQDLEHMLEGPSAAHWLGTDDLGRDVLSRLIHGGANSLYAALLAVAVALLIGIPLGLIAGFVGGWTDVAISRLIDTFLSFPAIILAVAVTGAMGIGLTNAMFSVGLVFAPQIARLIRARTLVVRQELYVDAARCFGASPLRLLGRHVLPNAIQPVIVQSTLLLAVALLAEASLSFLGLGVQPPDVSWGAMIARGYLYMSLVPEQMYAPGLIIMITAVAFNALGESMRTALDPTARGHG
ncbi:oligopeptide ABC transporter permease [Alcanivorax sp. 521-1]|uniref:Oligopeptide ABC transporter permease n=1 Tax=Alloalcanivorax profundimaris TaxID=2735259 RepID=A0ABS0AUB1_9GAMM|nr:ABC transporter permease [Alloalcanivorax profundimaris]MBF5057202.1 oligopeptide ABC transporter permease [Alloalcanivorax profundimaris]